MPWSISLLEYGIEPECTVRQFFQFKQWGTACGYSWIEHQTFHRILYFAFVNVITGVRTISLLVAILSNLLMIFVIFYGIKKEVVTLVGMVVGIISIIAVSDYSNEMDTTMTLPSKYILTRGPGYLFQLLTAAYGGVLFFVEFYINYYRKTSFVGSPSKARGMEFLSYLLSSLAVMISFGDLLKIENCPDLVGALDRAQCPNCTSSRFSVIAALSAINLFGSISTYLSVKFLYSKKWFVNGCVALTLIANLGILICSSTIQNMESVEWAFYACLVDLLVGLMFVGVYNQVYVFPR